MAKPNDWKTFLGGSGAVLGYFVLLTFWGVDWTDTGYNLVLQNALLDSGCTSSPMMFLSNLAGGLWLRLSPYHPWFWWSTLGGARCWPLLGGCSTLLLRPCLHSRTLEAVAATLVGFIPVPTRNLDLQIHYYTFPALLTALYLLALWPVQCGRFSWRQIGLLGFLNAALIASRLTAVSLCLVPLFLFAVNMLQAGHCRIRWDLPVKWLAGFLPGLLGFGALYFFLKYGAPPDEFTPLGDNLRLAAGNVMIFSRAFIHQQLYGMAIIGLWTIAWQITEARPRSWERYTVTAGLILLELLLLC